MNIKNKFRKVLIEKYDKPTEISFGDPIIYFWRNKKGQLHRKNGLPARINLYNENREWWENGKLIICSSGYIGAINKKIIFLSHPWINGTHSENSVWTTGDIEIY